MQKTSQRIDKYFVAIDLLRCFCVLSVVFYHLNFTFFSHGYLGVDIFFVISGFLMFSRYSELNNNNSKGHFHVMTFLTKRANRLYPAMIVVLMLSCFLALIFLIPNEARLFFEATYTSLIFTSNFVFNWHVGYFDFESYLKPNLHLWSLALEGQFYLFFAFFSLMTKNTSKSRKLYLIIFIYLLSLLSLFLPQFSDMNKFYLFPFRLWEFLAGALALFIIEKNSFFRIKRSICLALFLVSLIIYLFAFFVNHDFLNSFGLRILLVTGASVIFLVQSSFFEKYINANSRFSIISILKNIGKMSYSIYLIHFPLICFSILALGRHLLFNEKVIIVLATFVLSYISYRYIEIPFQKKSPKKYFVFLGLFVFMFGIYGHISNGFYERMTLQNRPTSFLSDFVDTSIEKRENFDCLNNEECHVGNGSERVLIFGDSHAADFITLFIKEYKNRYKIDYIGAHNCSFYLTPDSSRCLNVHKNLSQYLSLYNYKKIIWIEDFYDYGSKSIYAFNDLKLKFSKLINELNNKSDHVIVFKPNPKLDNNIRIWAMAFGAYPQLQKIRVDKYHQLWSQYLFVEMSRINLFDTEKVILDNSFDFSLSVSKYNNRALYRDGTHLTRYGASLIFDAYLEYLYQMNIPL